jgi:hypothetical protein
MAHLPEDDESVAEDYSDSFELDDTDSKASSDVSYDQFLASAVESGPKHLTPSPTQEKPPRPKRVSSSGGDLCRTIRSPVAMSEYLCQSDVVDGAKGNEPTLSFKEAAKKIQKLQSSVKNFNSSGEIRDIAFKEWLAKKEVKDMQTRVLLEQGKRLDDEKRRNKEVCFLPTPL